jgi:hypothetical protein
MVWNAMFCEAPDQPDQSEEE